MSRPNQLGGRRVAKPLNEAAICRGKSCNIYFTPRTAKLRLELDQERMPNFVSNRKSVSPWAVIFANFDPEPLLCWQQTSVERNVAAIDSGDLLEAGHLCRIEGRGVCCPNSARSTCERATMASNGDECPVAAQSRSIACLSVVSTSEL
jgi:hypothetical protein